MKRTSSLEINPVLNPALHRSLLSIPESDRYFIALSGGLDSVALLTLSLPYLKRFSDEIHVVHVHHGLSANASQWADFCCELSNKHGLHFHLERVSVTNQGKGIEAAARKARYAVFESYLQSGGVLLQGHHLNDQAETVLMRVLRGLGPEAIRGIPQFRALGNGFLFRPFINVPRLLMESALRERKQFWVEDESNQDSRFDRNYLRNEVMPLLAKRKTMILENLASCGRKSAELDEFAKEWFDEQKQYIISKRYVLECAIQIDQLLVYSQLQQSVIIRQWLDKLIHIQPNQACFERIFTELLVSRKDAKAEVYFEGYVLRVFDECLFCLTASLAESLPLSNFSDIEIQLNLLDSPISIMLPSGLLMVEHVTSTNASKLSPQINNSFYTKHSFLCRLPAETNFLRISYRKGGERMSRRSAHTSELKKIYQSEKVQPWWRDKFPLVFCDDELILSMAGFQSINSQLDLNDVKFSQNEYLLEITFTPNTDYQL